MDKNTLSDLLKDVAATGPEGLAVVVSGVSYRSDLTQPGDAFFCVPGLAHDGHDFAKDAAARGASVLVVERVLAGAEVPQVVVADARESLAWASARLFGMPSQRLAVIGVTGTNGKTTACHLVDAIARSAGHRTGLIGTVETRIADIREPAGRTTPESRDLQELLSRMVAADVATVAMEVSSHAIDLHRVDGVDFAAAAFTNLSQDHLDYHGTMEEYFAVKARLFSHLSVGQRVIDVDTEPGARLAEMVGAEWTVSRCTDAVVRARDVRLGPASSRFTLVAPSGEASVELPLAGDFNVSNALVAAGCCLAIGIDIGSVAEGLRRSPQVPGRLERIDEGQDFSVLVDYAHTADALAKAISAVRGVTQGKVITVFGCGGDRDPGKRPQMGIAAGGLSDIVVLTSDNPRSEDPLGIMLQVQRGLRCTHATKHSETDRRQAIALALRLASPGDAVLIAGKGHEGYQIFADGTVHFDDREVAREELRALTGKVSKRC